MFVGAYWSVRRESREEVARRLTRLLSSFANAEPTLSEWFLKGRTKASARTALEIDVAVIASKLKVNRRDVGGEVISELGFSFNADRLANKYLLNVADRDHDAVIPRR